MALQNFIIFSTTTLVLVLLLLSLSPHPTTAQFRQLVLDTAGNPVEPGSEYIISVSSALPRLYVESVTRAPKPGERCPLYAFSLIHPFNVQKAQPVRFIVSNNPNQTHFADWEEVRINSGASLRCRSRGFWTMVRDQTTGEIQVVAAGAPRGTPVSSFRLRRVDPSFPTYSINYCNGHDCRPLVKSSTQTTENEMASVLAWRTDDQANSRGLRVSFIKKPTTPDLADE